MGNRRITGLIECSECHMKKFFYSGQRPQIKEFYDRHRHGQMRWTFFRGAQRVLRGI